MTISYDEAVEMLDQTRSLLGFVLLETGEVHIPDHKVVAGLPADHGIYVDQTESGINVGVRKRPDAVEETG